MLLLSTLSHIQSHSCTTLFVMLWSQQGICSLHSGSHAYMFRITRSLTTCFVCHVHMHGSIAIVDSCDSLAPELAITKWRLTTRRRMRSSSALVCVKKHTGPPGSRHVSMRLWIICVVPKCLSSFIFSQLKCAHTPKIETRTCSTARRFTP